MPADSKISIFNFCILYHIAEGWCQNILDMAPSQDLKELGGRDFSSLEMLLIPEGFQVTLISIKDKAQMGPIHGRLVVNKFCSENWDSILVKKFKPNDVSGLSAAEFPLLCEEIGYGGYCQQLGNEFKKGITRLDSIKGN